MADNPLKYSAFIQPDDSISNLIKQLEDLSTKYAELLNTVKGNASNLEKTVKNVNSATTEGQEATREAAAEAAKLAKAHKALSDAQSDNAKQLVALKAEQEKQNRINKLTVAINNAAEGSMNKLSAQFSLNTIKLNAMSSEERNATEAGRALVTETNAIYEQMKKLQAETGKTTLNVGNYEAKTMSLREQLRRNSEALAELTLKGQTSSAAYKDLLAKTGALKDAMMDSQQAVTRMASDTAHLDTVMSGATAAAGGFTAYTGIMELLGSNSEETAKAQKHLQAAMALTGGLMAVQNALQKQSALMLGISALQSKALAKAEAYRTIIQNQGTKATIGATIAQRAFNLVATANPYVLLAVALISVIGALVIFANHTETAAKKQVTLNSLEKEHIELLGIEAKVIDKASSMRVKAIESEIKAAKARGSSLKETSDLEDKLLAARVLANAKQKGFYADELKNLEANREKLRENQEELSRLNAAKVLGSKKIVVNIEGKVSYEKIDVAIQAVQGYVENYTKLVEIGEDLTAKQEELDIAEKERIADRIKTEQALYAQEIALIRREEDVKTSLINNNLDKQIAETESGYARQIADLKYQLETDKTLTIRSKEALTNTILLLEQKKNVDLKDIQTKHNSEQIALRRASEDILVALMGEGYAKERAETTIEYNRRLEDIRFRLETERGLTIQERQRLVSDMLNIEKQKNEALKKIDAQNNINLLQSEAQAIQLKLETTKEGTNKELDLKTKLLQKQRAIELAENAMKTEDVRQSEADINAKYDNLILKQSSEFAVSRATLLFERQQALAASEFELLKTTEQQKTQFRLKQEKERLQKMLEINALASTKLSDIEVQTIKNTIAKIDNELKISAKQNLDIYTLTGLNLDEQQKSRIEESTSFAIGQLNNYLQAKIASTQAGVNAANAEVESTKKRLDAEIEARNAGYAFNVTDAQRELDLAKKNQEKALKEQEKARKAQALLDSLAQVSSLTTATANIWKSFTGAGPWGVALAIAATALMWGSFAASKIKAAQLTKKEYAEGGYEVLEGGSHASGNDVKLGITADGRDRRAEGGEGLAIIKRSSTRRYKNLIPDVISSLNKGVFEQKYMRAYDVADMHTNVYSNNIDIKNLESDVRDIRTQNERKFYTDAKGRTIERYKNLTRIYNA